MFQLSYSYEILRILVVFILQREAQFRVFIKKLNDLLLHTGLFLSMSVVQLGYYPGDLLLFDLILMLFKLFHCLFQVLLAVRIGIDDHSVLFMQVFQLIFQLFYSLCTGLALFCQKLILVDVCLILTQLYSQTFNFVQILFVKLLVSRQLV